MPKRPVKASASSTRAFSSGFGTSFGASGFSSSASSLSYVWEPPDLSSVSDANLVVAFKNLSKKDSTTKAKGLEDIQSYVTISQDIEEAVLETWVRNPIFVHTAEVIVMRLAGTILPQVVHRQCPTRSPTLTHRAGENLCRLRQASSETHAESCWCLALWDV